VEALRFTAHEGLTVEAIDEFAALACISSHNAEKMYALRTLCQQIHLPSPSPNAEYIHTLWQKSMRSGLCSPDSAQTYEELWRDIETLAQAQIYTAA